MPYEQQSMKDNNERNLVPTSLRDIMTTIEQVAHSWTNLFSRKSEEFYSKLPTTQMIQISPQTCRKMLLNHHLNPLFSHSKKLGNASRSSHHQQSTTRQPNAPRVEDLRQQRTKTEEGREKLALWQVWKVGALYRVAECLQRSSDRNRTKAPVGYRDGEPLGPMNSAAYNPASQLLSEVCWTRLYRFLLFADDILLKPGRYYRDTRIVPPWY